MKDNNVINYYMDKQSGIVYKKYEEKGEIVPVPRKEKPDRLRDGFRAVLTIFADTMSDIMKEHVRPEDAVGVMWATMDVKKMKDTDTEDDLALYRERLRLYMPEDRADAYYKKTQYGLDQLIAVVSGSQKKEKDIVDEVVHDDDDLDR